HGGRAGERALAGPDGAPLHRLRAGPPPEDGRGPRGVPPRLGQATVFVAGVDGALLHVLGPARRPDDGSARRGLPPRLGQPTLLLSYLVNGPMRMRRPLSRVGSFSIVYSPRRPALNWAPSSALIWSVATP